MKRRTRIYTALALAMTSLLTVNCMTTGDDKLAAPANYVFPRVKYTEAAAYSLTSSERKLALREIRKQGFEVLYEVVAAQDGTITKIRTIKSLPGHNGDYFTIGFMQQLQARKLKPSQMSAPYRTFFFPMRVRSTTEFLGSDGFID